MPTRLFWDLDMSFVTTVFVLVYLLVAYLFLLAAILLYWLVRSHHRHC